MILFGKVKVIWPTKEIFGKSIGQIDLYLQKRSGEVDAGEDVQIPTARYYLPATRFFPGDPPI